ncbi:cobyrinate a,c-diamide synthase [Actinoplanes siamensis]|uniref:cobyrinate a,c-diamide synthase n=1 Tax=Actinoplanes siamensis TaxID=1223317 RepID=UPI001EF2CBA0|nr:cobyrinate a,c-diamide synthase [Actinoplanes siamensis]
MSAPASGHGKTAIAVGLLAAMAARGIPTAGFKVGPDHTDAAYLGLASGRPGRNLDPRLVGAQRIAPLFGHGASGAQLSVIEGAMGLFDSLTGQPEVDGTAAVAAALRAPVALVVDVAAMGHSLAALVHGFRMFDEMVHLGGVILNRVASPRHEQMLRSALDDIGMPVLGALRRGDLPNVLPSRTHGLVPVAHRSVEAARAVRRLGEAVARSLDLDRLMALANSAPSLPGPLWTPAEAAGDPAETRPLVALAGGPGAPYTYVETAELLTAAGAEVVVVDPLRDESLPPGTRALVVGSGLPEGYAEELSANRRLCADVARFARDGWPVVAEGVALPWLGRELDGRPMCGVLDITGSTGEQTVAGYREATAPGTSVLAPAGARITGYKQHRAVVTPRAGAAPAWTWSGGNPEGFVWRQVHASQLGLHWAAAPEIAKRLVAAAIAGPAKPSGPAGQMPGPQMPTPQVSGPVPQLAGPAPQLAGPAPQLAGPAPQLGGPGQPMPMSGPRPRPVQDSISGPLPGGPAPSGPPSDPAPTTGPVPGMFPPEGPGGMSPPPGPAFGMPPADAAGPGMSPGHGPLPQRPGGAMPNGGPIHGTPDTGPDARPPSDVPISS